MQITDIRMKRSLKGDAVIAYCDITLENKLVIHGIKLVEGTKGTHVSFPSAYDKKYSKFSDVVHPIDQNFRNYITEKVKEYYTNDFE